MIGPPGSGKSMLAQRLPSILPPLSAAELLEVSMIHSIAGQLSGGKLSDRRPFRTPHHSATMAALVGGGLRAKPGEASLAHHGILFLDELPEFAPPVLDALRQPLETGECIIARANHRVSYPSDFQLVAAMNPCRCGMAGEPGHVCARGLRCQTEYQGRISGPLMDRIDIRIDVPAVSATDLIKPRAAESSADVAKRVAAARARQRDRFERLGLTFSTNARCSTALIETLAEPDASSPRAPGTLESHYAPRARLRLMPAEMLNTALQMLGDSPLKLAVYSRTVRLPPRSVLKRRVMPDDPDQAAHELFATLRELDAESPDLIWVEEPPTTSVWDGVRDRLSRAAA